MVGFLTGEFAIVLEGHLGQGLLQHGERLQFSATLLLAHQERRINQAFIRACHQLIFWIHKVIPMGFTLQMPMEGLVDGKTIRVAR